MPKFGGNKVKCLPSRNKTFAIAVKHYVEVITGKHG